MGNALNDRNALDGTLDGLHGTIGTENGTLNGLHGTIGMGNGTLNGLHGTIGTVNVTLNHLLGTVFWCSSTIQDLYIISVKFHIISNLQSVSRFSSLIDFSKQKITIIYTNFDPNVYSSKKVQGSHIFYIVY
jgi:hypothetical protein